MTLTLSRNTTLAAKDIEEVQKGILCPIRTITNEQSADLQNAIALCAKVYCGASIELNGVELFQEAARLVKQKFGHLGVNELVQAFRLCAANKLAVNMTAFAGVFTVAMLGDILSAYSNFRATIRKELQDAELELGKSKPDTERILQGELNTLNYYFSLCKDNLDCNEIPVYVAQTLIKYNLVNLSESDKKQIWFVAQERVYQQIKQERIESMQKADTSTAKIINDLIQKIEQTSDGKHPEQFIDKAKVVYAKLLVYELVFKYENVLQAQRFKNDSEFLKELK